MRRLWRTVWLVLALLLPWGGQARAYSLLTHEQLVDLTWDDSIVPLLLSRYPNLTPAELDTARAYAYGGCVIQDIGYYPFGDVSYSDLTHYVRSGDFIVNLFRDANNANEMAFAIGALSHYIGDSVGHPGATNVAVAIEFPKLGKKYGRAVTFSQGEHEHVETEFAFDINEELHHRVAPIHYLRHIGLQVPLKQLSLAFYQTYGMGEDFSGKRGRRVNVRAYRFAVRAFIPRIAYATALLHHKHILADPTTPEALMLEKEVATVAQENNWDAYRHRAGIGTYMLAGLLFVLPKVGPLRLVDVKGPTATTEADYLHSVVQSTTALRHMLARFTPPAQRHRSAAGSLPESQEPRAIEASSAATQLPATTGHAYDAASDRHHPLPNSDLDTGQVVQPGGYPLTDSTYAQLLHILAAEPKVPIPPGIKEDILAFYANPDLPNTTKKNPHLWAQVQADLVIFRTMPTNPEPDPYPTYADEDDGGQ